MMFFSNRHRLIKIVILAGIAGSLGLYAYLVGPTTRVSYQDCLKDPSVCSGQTIAVFCAPVISQDGENLIVKDCRGPILIKNIKEKIKANYISVKGQFQDKALLAEEIQTHPYRYLKYIISLLTVVLVGLAFGQEFTFDGRKMIFKKKPST